MKRVALVSDVHGNLPALESALPVLESADLVLCAGDVVGYYTFPNEVVDIARGYGWRCVRGNHENALLDGEELFNPEAADSVRWTAGELEETNGEWIEGLPAELSLELEGVNVFVTHGSPGDPDRYVMPDVSSMAVRGMLETCGCDVLVLGHTHVPMGREVEEGVLVNPGSVGQPRDGDPRLSVALMEVSGGSTDFEFVRKPYTMKRVRRGVERAGLSASLWERLFRGR
ncbi:MAG: Phosphodiesterase [Methanonatronarchaeales archaeon]|nr:Phosphodiesterase [Methanonatronarchaeales archaeon]